jgi:abequosyltransferase
MTAPLLSICIATYNRARMIGQTLDSIISQIRDEVEIIVVDGASTDDTPDVMRQYQDRCQTLRYHRLAVKGGVDRDYCYAVSFAAGKYCWLMTDDDIVKPGAINTVLALLPRKFSLIVLNAEVRDRLLVNCLDPRRLRLSADTYYAPSSRKKLFIETANYLTFIGAVVIDRALWNERLKDPYIGTEFIHVGVIFQKDLPHGAFLVASPYLIIRFGNAQWSPRHFEIWQIKWPRLIWSFPDIDDEAKARISPRYPWKNMTILLLERACEGYTIHEYKEHIEARLTSRWNLFIAKIIALFPGEVLNLFAVIFFSIAKSYDRVFFHRLVTSRFYYRQYFPKMMQSLKKAVHLF